MRVLKLLAVHTLWAIADTLETVRDGLIVTASKIVTR